MFTSSNADNGYHVEYDSHGILVFRFEQVTVETVEAWYTVQVPFSAQQPTKERPGLFMLIDTNGHDTIPFAQITQRAVAYTRENKIQMPIRHAWVMPTSPLTQAARPMLRALEGKVDIDVRFFSPQRRQMAYAWLIAEQANLRSRVM